MDAVKSTPSVKELFERQELLKDSIGYKVTKFKEEIGYKNAEAAFVQKKTLVTDYEARLKDEAKQAYGDFTAAMAGYESLDGIDRVRKDPAKKNNWVLTKNLTPAKLMASLPDDSILQDAIKTKREFNESLVKQMLADGELIAGNGHVTDSDGQILDEFISAELKPDDFKEAK
ncbi:hypothetical protein [Levilactobacillus andaensis]|uniref:hypothetical protein n=1 Tax=Levilactobacillus andaensis TaxID=2799570 RepID=UPI001945748F|nr:hypothetical protein [Levilactobacillus andaensis]